MPAAKPLSFERRELEALKRLELDPDYVPPKEFSRARKVYDDRKLLRMVKLQERSLRNYYALKTSPLVLGVVLFGSFAVYRKIRPGPKHSKSVIE